jgi:hypothetical protein
VGGAAVTEEFHPGFRNSTASYTVSLLNPKVIRDLRLAEHGLRVVERPFSNFLPLADGDRSASAAAWRRRRRGREVLEARRRAPAGLLRAARGGADVLRGLLLETPPNVGGGPRDSSTPGRPRSASSAADEGTPRGARPLHDVRGDWLDRWFESDRSRRPSVSTASWQLREPYTPAPHTSSCTTFSAR